MFCLKVYPWLKTSTVARGKERWDSTLAGLPHYHRPRGHHRLTLYPLINYQALWCSRSLCMGVHLTFFILSKTCVGEDIMLIWAACCQVTLTNYTSDWKQAKNSMAHEVSLHICFIHAFVNPLLFLVLNKDLRQRAVQMLCCVINSGYSDNYGSFQHTVAYLLRQTEKHQTLVWGKFFLFFCGKLIFLH